MNKLSHILIILLLTPNVYANDISYVIDKNLISVSKNDFFILYTPYKNIISGNNTQKILRYNECIKDIDLRLIAPKLIQELNNKNIKIFDVENFIDKEIEKELNNCNYILWNSHKDNIKQLNTSEFIQQEDDGNGNGDNKEEDKNVLERISDWITGFIPPPPKKESEKNSDVAQAMKDLENIELDDEGLLKEGLK